jgi:hypothetical protein
MAFLPTSPGSQGRHFFPLVFRLALKLEQLQWNEFTEDPALAAFSLRSAQRLFRSRAVINWFDDWLEAEGAGVAVIRDELGNVLGAAGEGGSVDAEKVVGSAPVQCAIDLCRRLADELDEGVATVGYLTGPATMSQRLNGRSSLIGGRGEAHPAGASVCTMHARALCEANCGALLMVEHEPLDSFSAAQYSAAINIASYYGKPIGLLSRHPLSAEFAVAAKAAGFSIVVPSDVQRDVTVIPTLQLTEEPAGRPFNVGLVMTDWEVPTGTAPESLIRLSQEAA